MYQSFEEAKNAAIETINKLYNGDNMNCCVTETKLRKNSKKTFFNFRFHENDSNGEFVKQADGCYIKFKRI